jgi:hypothetical protein
MTAIRRWAANPRTLLKYTQEVNGLVARGFETVGGGVSSRRSMAWRRTLLAVFVALYGALVPVHVCRAAGGSEAAWNVAGEHAPHRVARPGEHETGPCGTHLPGETPHTDGCCADVPLDLAPPFVAPWLAPEARGAVVILPATVDLPSSRARPLPRPERPPGIEAVVLLR